MSRKARSRQSRGHRRYEQKAYENCVPCPKRIHRRVLCFGVSRTASCIRATISGAGRGSVLPLGNPSLALGNRRASLRAGAAIARRGVLSGAGSAKGVRSDMREIHAARHQTVHAGSKPVLRVAGWREVAALRRANRARRLRHGRCDAGIRRHTLDGSRDSGPRARPLGDSRCPLAGRRIGNGQSGRVRERALHAGGGRGPAADAAGGLR